MGIAAFFSPQHRANDTADIAKNVDSIKESVVGIHKLVSAYETKAYQSSVHLHELKRMGFASGTLGAQLQEAIKNNIRLSRALNETANSAIDAKDEAMRAQQDQLKPKSEREIKRSGSDLRKQSEALAVNLRLALLKCKVEVGDLEKEQAKFEKPMRTVLSKLDEPLQAINELNRQLMFEIPSTDIQEYVQVSGQREEAVSKLEQVKTEVKHELTTRPAIDKHLRYQSSSSMYQFHKVSEARTQERLLGNVSKVNKLKTDFDARVKFKDQMIPQAKQMLELLDKLGFSHLKPELEHFIATQEPIIQELTETTFKHSASNLKMQVEQLPSLYNAHFNKNMIVSDDISSVSQRLYISAHNSYVSAQDAFEPVLQALPRALFFTLRESLNAQRAYERASAHLERGETEIGHQMDPIYQTRLEKAKNVVESVHERTKEKLSQISA
jgi:hypothetical protein